MKILHIVGNRPQFIKLAMLHRALLKNHCESNILHTGQHFDQQMSQVFFDQMDIPKPYNHLNINNLPHGQLLGKLLMGIDSCIPDTRPDKIVVYGDTNSTLAGALAARKRNIPLIHIEAGIRTGNEEMPEESNRYLTDRMSTINFCCTYKGMENLKLEGYGTPLIPGSFFNCGDLMLDACRTYEKQALEKHIQLETGVRHPFVLASIHREENTEKPGRLEAIIGALNEINKQMQVVLPLHPKTKRIIQERKIKTQVLAVDALGYLEMLALLQKSHAVITDSGGLSREAFFQNKKTMVVMEKPFWPELFEHGPCLHARAVQSEVLDVFDSLMHLEKPFNTGIFGDGHAAEKISSIIAGAN